eukprot:CAMPEP_0197616408 /NCGR_PEP_ID=MMETSP1326-20131121/60515_1 /TAXON_ID=1155430 /ORGANISM="Genus nov. species nov., Strain RCC2288" /LENGTH=160 /DNA_ID=CAMNT_0043185295 /DNA_START=257 /DNA_END=739 /DNA_ORIENTATION=-
MFGPPLAVFWDTTVSILMPRSQTVYCSGHPPAFGRRAGDASAVMHRGCTTRNTILEFGVGGLGVRHQLGELRAGGGGARGVVGRARGGENECDKRGKHCQSSYVYPLRHFEQALDAIMQLRGGVTGGGGGGGARLRHKAVLTMAVLVTGSADCHTTARPD